MKKKILMAAVMVILVTLAACKKETAIDVASVIGTDKMKTFCPVQVSYVVAYNDLSELTTYQSYVFVGRVENYVETIDYGDDYSATTVYSVQVIENIKGQLTDSEPIRLEKVGGNINGTDKFIVLDGDFLPQVGKMYIFIAGVWNGIPYCGMPNTNIPVDENYRESEVYNDVVEACKTTVALDILPKETVSIYDVNYRE